MGLNQEFKSGRQMRIYWAGQMQGRNQQWLHCPSTLAQSQPPNPSISSILITTNCENQNHWYLSSSAPHREWKILKAIIWLSCMVWASFCRWPVWVTRKCHDGIFVCFLLPDLVNNARTYTNIHTHTHTLRWFQRKLLLLQRHKLKNKELTVDISFTLSSCKHTVQQ